LAQVLIVFRASFRSAEAAVGMNQYRFSNLLGATYQGGSIQFTPDGNTLLSPVGNRVSAVDLIQGRSTTLSPENREDIAILALSPDGRVLLSIDKAGHALLINFVRGAILCRINFKAHVRSAKWSPDSNWLAVTHGRRLQIWRAPTLELGWQFVQHRTFGGHHDDVIDVAWSPDSLFLATAAADMSVRLWSLNPMNGFEPLALAEHRSHVRAVFFSGDSKYLYSMSREGVLVSLRYEEEEDEIEGTEGKQKASDARALYCRPGAWVMAAKAYCQQPGAQKVTRCAFDAASNLFASGFSGGIFMLFEMPGLQALQTLSLGSQPLDAIALGANGDWLAVGSSEVGQLFVWEWRSETYILKQQGHHWGVQCVAFSPSAASSLKQQKTLATTEGKAEDRGTVSGRLLATGGHDGKVKVFSAQSGLCFVTFAEHTAPVTALCFTPQGNAILTASQDGSVRAFDLLRYRNFRTFASPDGLCQWSSVAVDSGGEIVAAAAVGGKYTIYVWSIQTGNVLEVLAGHTSQVQSLMFSPSTAHPGQMISGGWDGVLSVWALYTSESKGGEAEKLQCASSVLSVAFDPRGNDICAAACLTGVVQFWNVTTAATVGSIEGLRDIQSGRQIGQRYGASHKRGVKLGAGLGKAGPSDGVNLNQHFSSIAYARSGELLLCGSRNSPHVCLYDTTSYSLAFRLTLTSNRSLSGVQTMLNSKHVTESGVPIQQFDLSDSEGDDAELTRQSQRIKQVSTLPGVHVGEAKDRYASRELHVWDVHFSPDSQQFAAATTHGVFVYAADTGVGGASSGMGGHSGSSQFVPQMLTKNVSAPAILKALKAGDLSRAMILALALNDYGLVRKVYESIPVRSIPIVVASIGAPLLPALLWFLGLELRPSSGTPHFQFHVHWVATIIDVHFMTLLDMATGKTTARTGAAIEAAAASRSDVAALCLQLLVELSQRHAGMTKVFDGNIYLLRYLGTPQRVALEDEGAVVEPPQEKAGEQADATAASEQSKAKKKKRPRSAAGSDREGARPKVKRQ